MNKTHQSNLGLAYSTGSCISSRASQLHLDCIWACRAPTNSVFSPSTVMADRSRSRSPRARENPDRERPRKTTGGFRWKDKSRTDDSRGDDRRLERGYRDRPRSPRRDREGDRYGDRPRDGDRDRAQQRDNRDAPREDREKKVKKEKKKPVAPQSSEPMIVVHVNDRLGTKAAIPCLASDPISTSCFFFFFIYC